MWIHPNVIEDGQWITIISQKKLKMKKTWAIMLSPSGQETAAPSPTCSPTQKKSRSSLWLMQLQLEALCQENCISSNMINIEVICMEYQIDDLNIEVICHIINVEIFYNLLLGRAQIHSNLFILFTLHQSLNYVDKHWVIKIVYAESNHSSGQKTTSLIQFSTKKSKRTAMKYTQSQMTARIKLQSS